jgi:hypothetical protein
MLVTKRVQNQYSACSINKRTLAAGLVGDLETLQHALGLSD